MKDWKAECDKLKGELVELRRQLQYERDYRKQREDDALEIKNNFKDLLIKVLRD